MAQARFSSPQQLTNEYFYRMLSPEALRIAHTYLAHEEQMLEAFLIHTPQARQMNFVAIGAGEFSYLQHGLTYASRYVLIEPNMDIFFNVISYIEDPIQSINRIIRKGDILFLSSWAKNQKARTIRKEYLTYLNNAESHPAVDLSVTTGLCNLDEFPFEKLKYYSRHVRQNSTVTDVLIIYT